MNENCPRIVELSAWLDEQLAASERRALEVHVADCPICAATFADLGVNLREITVPWSEADIAATGGLFGAEALAAHRGMFPEHAERYGPRTRSRFETYPRIDAASVARG